MLLLLLKKYNSGNMNQSFSGEEWISICCEYRNSHRGQNEQHQNQQHRIHNHSGSNGYQSIQSPSLGKLRVRGSKESEESTTEDKRISNGE